MKRMNKRTFSFIIFAVLGLVIISGAVFMMRRGQPSSPVPTPIPTPTPQPTEPVRLRTPVANAVVTSPLVVSGEALGRWYFEASFPVRLLDADGKQIAVAPAQAQSDWMVDGYVPFTTTLTFAVTKSGTGTLVLEKDNPSGLPEYADAIRVPVRFEATTMPVSAFFINTSRDPDPAVQCDLAFPVTRQVTTTLAVARAAVEMLLAGPTVLEKNDGYSTAIPTGVRIQRLVIENGVAKVDFNAALEREVGGSCRVAMIATQIRKTLLQFPTVRDVVISIDGRTEDILQP